SALLFGSTALGQPNKPEVQGDPLPEGARMRLGSLRFRAPAEIQASALSPDGRMLAGKCDENPSFSSSGVHLYEAETGKSLDHLLGETKSWPNREGTYYHPPELQFSSDNKRLFVSGRRDEVNWRDIGQIARVQTYEPDKNAKELTFPDGGWLDAHIEVTKYKQKDSDK